VQKQMVIHGGISEDNKTFESMAVFNAQDYTWSEAIVKVKDDVKSKKASMIMKQLYYVNEEGI
jgi:hypothetical protein